MKNKNKKPNKPTEPFGSVAFGKNGSVRKHITNLSSDKQTQENEVITLFLEGIQRIKPNFQINNIKQLPEAGQDFLLDTPLGEITIELTEIVDREFTFKPSDKPYRSGGFDFHVLKQGELWPVDRMGLCIALQKSIEKKISKNYSKPGKGEFWLVIFSTSLNYPMEYHSGGKKKQSAGLLIAQGYLRLLSSIVFDQIWYTDLETNPIQIWPCK